MTDQVPANASQQILAFRKQHHLSQARLAQMLHVHRRSIIRAEQGHVTRGLWERFGEVRGR